VIVGCGWGRPPAWVLRPCDSCKGEKRRKGKERGENRRGMESLGVAGRGEGRVFGCEG